MSITLNQLENYAIASTESRAPVTLLNKYRIRLVPLKELPIIEHFLSAHADFPTENVLVIDSAIVKCKADQPLMTIKKEIIENIEEPMDYCDDKENDSGPLQTSFLSYDKLRKTNAHLENMEIVGMSIENDYYDCNPISISEALVISKILRKEKESLFDSDILNIPTWICTINNKTLPSITWMSSGTTSKNIPFKGITRILGYLNDSSQTDIQTLNEVFDTAQCAKVNKCRSVFEIIRKIETEKRRYPGEVVVDVKWNAMSNIELLSEPTCQADCTIKIDLGWRDSRFFTDDVLFNQFFFILDLVDVLTNPEKEVIFNTSDVEFDTLTNQMNKLIELSADDDKLDVIGKESGEITEHVWNILYQCNNIQEVIVLLRCFLQALSYRKVKSEVHDDNKSHLAQLIRLSKGGEFRMPRLERLNTIEIMMEIGVECLRRKLLAKFSKLALSEEELRMKLQECETLLKNTHGAVESRAISLLPMTMTLAVIHQINGLINDRFQSNIPEITRKIIGKFSTSTISQKRDAENGMIFTYDATLPFTILDGRVFAEKRAKVWTYERTISNGFNLIAKMMTCLQNGINLEHVNDIVNPTRPIRQIEENEERSPEDLKADYTVSHTVIAYYPNLEN